MRPARPAPAADLRRAFDRLIARTASATPGALRVARVPLPDSCRPLRLWDAAAPDDFAAFWEDGGEAVAAVGAVPGTRDRDASDDDAPLPRLLGAVPFAEGWWDEDWAPLAEAGFVLPRWTVRRDVGGGADLTLVLRAPLRGADLDALRREISAVEGALGAVPTAPAMRSASPTGSSPAPVPDGTGDASRDVWRRGVEAALAHIEAGELKKVVLARRTVRSVPPGYGARRLLDRLCAEGSGTFRFGLRTGGRAFVGASPECLFRKRGDLVEVEALAGTYDLGRGPRDMTPAAEDSLVRAAEHLFASGKDLEEHALVVRGIIEALEPLAEKVVPDEWPRVREARRLAHLSTTVRASLRPGVTALDLVAALHPTPAVGGLPREAALRFIRRVEPDPRGLYAAPVGWIGPEGDACFAVGIRSALLVEDRAVAYAGAGIVAASDPDAEWEETGAKLRWLDEVLENGT